MANVTEGGLKSYLETFESTYCDTATRFLDPDLRRNLERLRYFDRRLVGYVSTQFGCAFEYFSDPRLDHIETRRGSARIEEVVFADCPLHLSGHVVFVGIRGSRSRIEGGTFEGAAFPLWLAQPGADTTLVDTKFVVGRWQRRIRRLEIFGDRAADRWSVVRAVADAKDEILAALIDQQAMQRRRIDLASYLAKFKRRTVLVLGDFGSGRQRLVRITEALRERDYEPVLLDEVPEHYDYDLPEKFNAVAQVCRFLVFDDSGHAGHYWELADAARQEFVRVILRQEGTASSFMTRGQALKSRVAAEFDYNDANLGFALDAGIAFAEAQVDRLRGERNEVYPWREP